MSFKLNTAKAEILKKYWPLIFLFSGISVVMLVFVLDKASDTKIPTERLMATFPIDSSFIENNLLADDRYANAKSSLRLNGETEFLNIGNDKFSILSSFTFSFWAKIDTSGRRQTLFQKGESCPDGAPVFNGASYEINLEDDNTVSMVIMGGQGNFTDEQIQFRSKLPLPKHEWIFIAITFNSQSKEFLLYTNAISVPINSSGKSSVNFHNIHQTRSPLKIGARESYCNYIHQFSDFFYGYLDDINLYDKILNEDELRELSSSPQVKVLKYQITLIAILLIFSAVFIYKQIIKMNHQ